MQNERVLHLKFLFFMGRYCFEVFGLASFDRLKKNTGDAIEDNYGANDVSSQFADRLEKVPVLPTISFSYIRSMVCCWSGLLLYSWIWQNWVPWYFKQILNFYSCSSVRNSLLCNPKERKLLFPTTRAAYLGLYTYFYFLLLHREQLHLCSCYDIELMFILFHLYLIQHLCVIIVASLEE